MGCYRGPVAFISWPAAGDQSELGRGQPMGGDPVAATGDHTHSRIWRICVCVDVELGEMTTNRDRGSIVNLVPACGHGFATFQS